MYRNIEKELQQWRDQYKRKPLLVRGARQVGKSYVIEKFGLNHFDNVVTVNFELETKFIDCFQSLQPSNIIKAIELLAQKRIQAGKTLLFLDEIQLCPNAIKALRYFKEKMPALHVIGAGSFLEFVINAEQYQQPVGRVQSLYMKPVSLQEYLLASGQQALLDYLAEVTLTSGVTQAIHQLLLEKCREYFYLGGMPEVIDYYLHNNTFLGCEKIHASILEYYRRDLVKYSQKINIRILEKFFIKAPRLIAKRFKYVDIDPDIQARDQKPVLETMIKAGLIYPVYQNSASGLPLLANINEKKFKLLFLDLGLVNYALGVDPSLLLEQSFSLLHAGDLAEQFVGQELLAYGKSYQENHLFYWEREKRSSQAEVDYILQQGQTIYPLEVKAGKTRRLRSLHSFLQEKNVAFGIRIAQQPLSFSQNILSVPFYLIHELPRLITQCQKCL